MILHDLNAKPLETGCRSLVVLGSVKCEELKETSACLAPVGISGFRTSLVGFEHPLLICAPKCSQLNGWDVMTNSNGISWAKLDSVNLYVNQFQQQLVNYQSELSKLYLYVDSAPFPDNFSSYWTDEFEKLYSQANQLGVSTSRLRRARRLATRNAAQACRLLASQIRDAITERIAHLRRRLRIAKALKSKLLRLIASVYQFRNQIVLQRRYYLAHGSHPIVNSNCRKPRRSLDQRGCVPVLPQ